MNLGAVTPSRDNRDKLVVRPARQGDEAAVRAFGREVFWPDGGSDPGGDSLGDPAVQNYVAGVFEKYWHVDYLRLCFGRNDNVFLVAEDAGRLIGILHAHFLTPGAVTVSRLFVHREAREQWSLGCLLLRTCENLVPASVRRVITGAAPNSDELRFYVCAGFVPSRAVEKEIAGRLSTLIEMEKTVQRELLA